MAGRRRVILCFGNPLHGGDNLGHLVYRKLRHRRWPPDTELHPAGTDGLRALNLLENCRSTIWVDALADAGQPGRIHRLRADDLERLADRDGGSHAAGLPWLARAARAIYRPPPRILVIGAEIDALRPFAPEPAPRLEDAAGRIAALLWRLCGR